MWITLSLIITFLTSCSDFNKEIGLKDDNPIEQAIEQIIKEETGIVVDFTSGVSSSNN